MQKVVGAGLPQPTLAKASTDTSQSLEDLGITYERGDGRKQKTQFAVISVETAAIRINLNGAATTAVGHLWQPGEAFVLEGLGECQYAEIISAAAGVHATLQITPEF